MALALIAGVSGGCGKVHSTDPRTWGKTAGKPASAGDSLRAAGTGTKVPTSTKQPKTATKDSSSPKAPVETLLQDGLVLPARLKAETLTIHFRSNVAQATFACALGAASTFDACDDDSYSFGTLVHGRSYMLRVRAMAPDGRVDATPLVVSFVADKMTGTAPTVAANLASVKAIIPASTDDLPQPLKAGAEVSDEGRALQVGSFFAVETPANEQVTSYATTKTYNAALRYFRLVNGKVGSELLPSVPCAQEFERVVDGPAGSGTKYCDATPNADEWKSAYPTLLAKNHVETVLRSADGVDERLYVAAFDAEADSAEAAIGIQGLCQGSNYQGSTEAELLRSFFGEPLRETMTWCQAKDAAGQWWWIGTFQATLSTDPAAPARLKVIYAVNVNQGLFSGQQFATFAERRLPRLIIAIAPAAGTQ